MSKARQINDLNLDDWKAHDDILTDSLWMLGERDKSGAHNNGYHGAFIPQIPNQLMRRFTKKGDIVLDAFLGHGTTLIEAKRLGRRGIGVELDAQAAQTARNNIASQPPPSGENPPSEVIVADSATSAARARVQDALAEMGADKVQLIILHPPYHDIIKFSDSEADLSNAATAEEFAQKFGDALANFSDLLERNRYLAVVIGDKYQNGEWIPLGFQLMNETMRRDGDLKLKSILVKNMLNNRAKLNQENLWRYRALVGGFYIFKHEYILVFKKA